MTQAKCNQLSFDIDEVKCINTKWGGPIVIGEDGGEVKITSDDLNVLFNLARSFYTVEKALLAKNQGLRIALEGYHKAAQKQNWSNNYASEYKKAAKALQINTKG